MTAPILFDNAIDAAVNAIEAAGVDLTGCEMTLLRDLRGRLRLHVVRSASSDWPPTATTALKQALASVAPFGTEVVYLAGSKADPISRIVNRDRTPLATSLRQATWFKVERRFSKDAWILEQRKDQEPWPFAVARDREPAQPAVISFYGFKGGVGRTTALAAFALYAADELGRNVVVVDLDLEAPGVGTLLLGDAVPTDLGVVDFLIDAGIARTPPLAMTRYLLGSPFSAGSGSVRVMPAGRLDANYLEKLGRVDVQGLVELGAPLRAPLLSMLERIRDEARPDVILLDVRAGLHDLGGVSLSGLSHLELIFASNTPQTWAGVSVVLRHLGHLRAPWIRLIHTLVPPASRGGDDLHADFLQRAYDECCAAYYLENEIPGFEDDSAAHAAYRLPFREALMALSDLRVSKSELLSDEHRRFCERLARDVGLEESR
jgi:hypothetical protein